jgi:hypothetical protein
MRGNRLSGFSELLFEDAVALAGLMQSRAIIARMKTLIGRMGNLFAHAANIS